MRVAQIVIIAQIVGIALTAQNVWSVKAAPTLKIFTNARAAKTANSVFNATIALGVTFATSAMIANIAIGRENCVGD